MSERTPSGKIWAELETQLNAMDHAQLVRICAHLIRTYVVEGHASVATTPVTPSVEATQSAQQEQPTTTSTPPAATSPFGGPAPSPEPPAEKPPERKPTKQEPGYNKLEMD